MTHRVQSLHKRRLQVRDHRNVTPEKPDPAWQVLTAPRRLVVDDGYVMPLVEKALRKVGADETGSPGQEDLHQDSGSGRSGLSDSAAVDRRRWPSKEVRV